MKVSERKQGTLTTETRVSEKPETILFFFTDIYFISIVYLFIYLVYFPTLQDFK